MIIFGLPDPRKPADGDRPLRTAAPAGATRIYCVRMPGVSAVRIVVASLFCGAALFLPACSHTDGQNSVGLPADCIIIRTINDFDALDENDLVIYGPGDTAYHVVLTSPSNQIESEIAIGVKDDGDGRLCPYGLDSIIVEGALLEEIRIRSIESLDEGELEILLVEFGEIEAADPAVVPEQIL